MTDSAPPSLAHKCTSTLVSVFVPPLAVAKLVEGMKPQIETAKERYMKIHDAVVVGLYLPSSNTCIPI